MRQYQQWCPHPSLRMQNSTHPRLWDLKHDQDVDRVAAHQGCLYRSKATCWIHNMKKQKSKKIHRNHFLMGDHSKGIAFPKNRAKVVRSYTGVATTQAIFPSPTEPRSIDPLDTFPASVSASCRSLPSICVPILTAHCVPRIALTRFQNASKTPPSLAQDRRLFALQLLAAFLFL